MTAVFTGAAALVVYTFLGYPAVLAVWARLRPRPIRSDPAFLPSVSLIIAAYDEESEIVGRLENTTQTEYPMDRLEVIVVADGSTDHTAERAAAIPGIRVLHRPERLGKLAAITRAAEAAQGEVLIFSDANNRYLPRTVATLVAPFADPSVGVVAGRKAIDDGSGRPIDRAEGLYWRYESKIKMWESAVGSTVGAAGEVVAFRRAAFRPPPVGTMNEDLVQAVSAAADGWRVVYAPDAVSLERASATADDEAVRRGRLVTGRVQALVMLMPRLARTHPRLAWQLLSHKGLRPLVPWALVAMAASNIAALGRRRWAGPAIVAQTVFYGAALLGWRQQRQGRRSRLLFLPFYFCKMNVAAVKGLVTFLAGRGEHVWARVNRG